MVIFFACLFLLPGILAAADRVVLFEDFTNSGSELCWSWEPHVNDFVEENEPNNILAVLRVHVNWPSSSDPIYLANPIEQNVRKTLYGITSIPVLRLDGVLGVTDPVMFQWSLDMRTAVPAIIGIDVARSGDETSGSISIMIIAEEDPQWTVPMMVWPILVENNIPGVGYWSGSVFDQAFRDNLLGFFGEEISFTGPYPDTIYVEADYTLDPDWDANKLYLATFVQCGYQYSEREVENAHWAKFLDLGMGTGEGDWNGWQEPVLHVFPNPCTGTFSIAAAVPENGTGIVEVFNLSGRSVCSGSPDEMQSVTVDESGIYLIRLTTDTGVSVTESVVVFK